MMATAGLSDAPARGTLGSMHPEILALEGYPSTTVGCMLPPFCPVG